MAQNVFPQLIGFFTPLKGLATPLRFA